MNSETRAIVVEDSSQIASKLDNIADKQSTANASLAAIAAVAVPAIPIHGEVSSADASAGVAFTLHAAGATATRALTGTESLVITDIIFTSTVGGAYSITADADAAGKVIAKGFADALGGLTMSFKTPYKCPVGVVPKLVAAAGAVSCVIQGYIV